MATDAQLLEARQSGYTYKQIAGYFQLSEDSVRSRVSRARLGKAHGQAGNVIAYEDLYYPSARDINDVDAWADYLRHAQRRGKMLKVFFWPDLHIPDTSWQSVNLARQIRRYVKPDVDFFLGDEFDFDTLSTHWKRSENRVRRDAFKEVRGHWNGLQDALESDCSTFRVMLGGNHTRGRIDNFADERAPEIADTIIESFIELARANKRVNWLGWTDETWIGSYHIEHGTRTGENSAKNSLKDIGWSTPRTGGHVHSPSEVWNYVYRESANLLQPNRFIVQSVTLPCLCNIHPHYAQDKKKSRWMNGVGVAYINMNGTDVHQHKIVFHARANGDLAAAFGSETFTEQKAYIQEMAA